jgi:hypothetical protein
MAEATRPGLSHWPRWTGCLRSTPAGATLAGHFGSFKFRLTPALPKTILLHDARIPGQTRGQEGR